MSTTDEFTPAVVTTTRPIDLEQLAGERDSDTLTAAVDGETTTVTCWDPAVTAEAFQVAVDAHVPVPRPPAPPTTEELLAVIDGQQSQIDQLTDLMLMGL